MHSNIAKINDSKLTFESEMQDNFQQLVNQLNKNSFNKHKLLEDMHSLLKRHLKLLEEASDTPSKSVDTRMHSP